MKKISEIFKKDLTTEAEMPNSRREFFKKSAVYSVGAVAAAQVLSPISLRADDAAIVEEAPWGT